MPLSPLPNQPHTFKGGKAPKVNGTMPKGIRGGYGSLQFELDQSGKQVEWLGAPGSEPVLPGMILPSLPGGTASAQPTVSGQTTPPLIPSGLSQEQRKKRVQELRAKFDRTRLQELRAKFAWSDRDRRGDERDDGRDGAAVRDQRRGGREKLPSANGMLREEVVTTSDSEEWLDRLEDSVDNIQEAQEALEEMVEAEEEEQEVEEVEVSARYSVGPKRANNSSPQDLLEYYLQRASAQQDEAERLLAGEARWAFSLGFLTRSDLDAPRRRTRPRGIHRSVPERQAVRGQPPRAHALHRQLLGHDRRNGRRHLWDEHAQQARGLGHQLLGHQLGHRAWLPGRLPGHPPVHAEAADFVNELCVDVLLIFSSRFACFRCLSFHCEFENQI